VLTIVTSSLDALLAAVTEGDYEALGPLADLLEERGDPRADLARKVMELEPAHIAMMLCHVRAEKAVKRTEGWAALAADAFALVTFGIPPVSGVGGISFDSHATSDAGAVREVEEALSARQLSTDVAQAITLSRRAKCDRFLASFRDT
jgi:hypothetical protein